MCARSCEREEGRGGGARREGEEDGTDGGMPRRERGEDVKKQYLILLLEMVISFKLWYFLSISFLR